MKVLITGGGGYVGSALACHLAANGNDVRILDPLPLGAPSLVCAAAVGRLAMTSGSVINADDVAHAMTGVDAVIHLAAIVGESACDSDPQLAQRVNVEGTRIVFSAATRLRIPRSIMISTCSNYGVSSPDTLADEKSTLRPLGTYARTKVSAEQEARTHAPTATVLRLGTVCGPSPRMRFDLLVNELARDSLELGRVSVYTPEAWRPYLPTQDACRAISSVLMSPREVGVGQTFNVVTENLTKRALMEIVLREFPQTVVDIVDRAPDQRDYRVDGSKFLANFGNVLTGSVEESFLRTVELLRGRAWPVTTGPLVSAVEPSSDALEHHFMDDPVT